MKPIFICLLAVTLCGCGPSADDARHEIELQITGPLKLVSLKKTDGQTGQIQNKQGVMVHSYSLDYTAMLEATGRCEVLNPDEEDGWVSAHSLADGDSPIFTNNVLEVGRTLRLDGTMVFEKTEKGWQENRMDCRIYFETK